MAVPCSEPLRDSDSDRAVIAIAKLHIALAWPIGLGALVAVITTPSWRLRGDGLLYTVPLAGAVVLGLAGIRVARALTHPGRVAHGLLQGLGAALGIAAGMGWIAARAPDGRVAMASIAIVLGTMGTAALGAVYALLASGPRAWQPAPPLSPFGPALGITGAGCKIGVVLAVLSCCGAVVPSFIGWQG